MKRSVDMAALSVSPPSTTTTKKCKQVVDTSLLLLLLLPLNLRPTLITKLISGGQTGADRAALEAAESLGIETGGWAPRDFMTTRGETPELGTRFGLCELTGYKGSATQGLILRSQRNVDDSDGTLIFRLKNSPGTEKTIGYCQTQRWCYVAHQKLQKQTSLPPKPYKPYLVITSLSDCNP